MDTAAAETGADAVGATSSVAVATGVASAEGGVRSATSSTTSTDAPGAISSLDNEKVSSGSSMAAGPSTMDRNGSGAGRHLNGLQWISGWLDLFAATDKGQEE